MLQKRVEKNCLSLTHIPELLEERKPLNHSRPFDQWNIIHGRRHTEGTPASPTFHVPSVCVKLSHTQIPVTDRIRERPF